MLPAVPSMFERNINSDMSLDSLKKKFSRVLPRAIRKWSSDAVEELEQFSREQLGLSPQSKPSRIPYVIFRCRTCARWGPGSQRFRFDEALSHQHLYKEKSKGGPRGGTREMSLYDRFPMGHDTHPRDIQVLRVDVKLSRRVENLIRRMGRNPDRVTYVVCGLCPPAMDFEYAVRRRVSVLSAYIVDVRLLQFTHCLGTHLTKKETEMWTRVSAKDSK